MKPLHRLDGADLSRPREEDKSVFMIAVIVLIIASTALLAFVGTQVIMPSDGPLIRAVHGAGDEDDDEK